MDLVNLFHFRSFVFAGDGSGEYKHVFAVRRKWNEKKK